MNNQQLLELLYQMSGQELMYRENERSWTNEGTPAWNATRTAESLTDTAVIPFLRRLLEENSKEESFKRNIYFMLGQIGSNTGDTRVVDVLIERLDMETNKYTLSSILDQIAEQDKVPECTPIIKWIQDDRWLVRHSAILALKKCNCEASETALLGVIMNSSDVNDLCYAMASLCEAGSARSIPHLLTRLEHDQGEVRSAVIRALDALGDSSHLPIFIEALKDRSPAVKSYAMTAIHHHGDDTAVDAVLTRVKKMLSRKRKWESDDLILALDFLSRYKDDHNQIQNLILWIKTKKYDYLFDEEKQRVLSFNL